MANNGGRRHFMVIALSNAKDLKKKYVTQIFSQDRLFENSLVKQISFRSFMTVILLKWRIEQFEHQC